MAGYELLIRNGMVIDGSRAPRVRADVAIRDGKVARIGRVDPADADEVLDATGLVVAPGFVDLHTHYDAQLFWDPYCTLSGWHGITSVAIGNCGFGFAPVRPDERERAMLSMTRVEAIPLASMAAGMPWDWVTCPEFLDSVERAPKAVNVLPDGPSSVQRDHDGSPMPTDVMHDDTCRELARVLRERDDGFMQMLMISGDNARDRAFHEALAEIAGRPMLMNVVQAFDHRPDIHRRVLAWLRGCRERGVRVVGQGLTTDAGFAFTFEDWNLFDDAAPWREATTGTLAEKTGRHPVDVMLDMAVEEDLRTEFFAAPPNGRIDYLKEIVDDPYVLFGVSDGDAHTKFLTAGRYPTETICKVVREHAMIGLQEAHGRLSALPAQVAGFRDRGVLREGAPADVVVYDYERLRVLPAEIVHDLPGGEWRRIRKAEGYRRIVLNGRVTMCDGVPTHVHSGRLLRHGRA
jgi:N-acyl-D-aspartate/D-glutamate deacylase